MKMKFSKERLTDIWEELKPMAIAHAKELAPFPGMELDPDLEGYQSLYEANCLHSYTIRDTEDNDKLIGYSAFFISKHLQFSKSTQAVQDLIFLDPRLRKTGLGAEFIMWCDTQLEALGAEYIFHHTKTRQSFGPLLESLGYIPMDEVFARKV